MSPTLTLAALSGRGGESGSRAAGVHSVHPKSEGHECNGPVIAGQGVGSQPHTDCHLVVLSFCLAPSEKDFKPLQNIITNFI